MNFKTFSVDTTNVYPMTNSTLGGQFVTEYNIKSRESVITDDSVQWGFGPSFVHSESDFYVRKYSGLNGFFANDTGASSSSIEISSGRAVIDGHFVENLAPMIIDIAKANSELIMEGKQPMLGSLSVGLRVMYSTEPTMSGTISPENGDTYEGIQIVILPTENFHLPNSTFILNGETIDCRLEENKRYVNAHILLATLYYSNSSVSDITNNYPNKCQTIPAIRIQNINHLISDEYVRKAGLNEQKLYVFAGKGVGGNQSDTWCDATDSLMLWDSQPQLMKVSEMSDLQRMVLALKESTFISVNSDRIALAIPHKQVDGAGYSLQDAHGNPQQYVPKFVEFPVADYGRNTSGSVSASYTKSIKAIASKINNFYQLTNGKQRAFIQTLTSVDDLPPINPLWNPGDYIFVAQDSTLINITNDNIGITPPATIYVVLADQVATISNTNNSETGRVGVELDRVYIDAPEFKPNMLSSYIDLTVGYRGKVNEDYFTIVHDGNEYVSEVTSTTPGTKIYSSPVQLTAQLPFADENLVGGFLNVSDAATDNGYVYLDESGHLRLLDYDLLRSGTLAYQLGENFTVPSGYDPSGIQEFLDEYVNQRIAFPNVAQLATDTPNIIDINITLPDNNESDTNTLNIYDIDSRFNTAVRINLYGAGEGITINISDCAKVIINSSLSGYPIINLHRSCLYYDANVLNMLNDISDMSLWYEKLSPTDKDLMVNDKTVSIMQPNYDSSEGYSISSAEYWTPDNNNDNHFSVALQSLTFSGDGYVCGCSVLVRNDSTINVTLGKQLIHFSDFILPQGTLKYPERRFSRAVKVSGEFITAYKNSSHAYYVQDVKFSLATQHYTTTQQPGELAIIVDAYEVQSASPEVIDVWGSNTFHSFTGTALL